MERTKTRWLLAGVLCLALLPPTTYAQDTKWEKSTAAGTKAYQQGDYVEAEKQFKTAISEAGKFGEQDQRLAASLNNLAELYRTQGNYAQAEPLYKRSLAIYEKALGPEHPDVAMSLENYTRLLRKMDRDAEAGKMEARAQAIRAKHAQETSLRTVVVPLEEQAAFQEAVNQPGADTMIALAEKFLQDYPESQLRSLVYSALATTYREKNDYDKVVENGEKSLSLDPDNVMSLVIVAQVLPQRLGGSGLETAQKLSRAERYARHGLELVDSLSQPANLLPEEFEKTKATFKSMLHSALGFVYLQRGISAKSQEEYEIAVSLTISPDPIDYYRLGEAYSDQRKYDEAIEAFEKAAELSTSAIVDQLATEHVQRLKIVRDVMQGTGK